MIKVKRKNKKILQQRGITLVALVVTIIILLILAGISIQALTNTGIFAQAENAKRESEIANIKEQIALDIYEKQLEPPLGSITEEQLEEILGKYGTVNKGEDETIIGITTEDGYEILLKDIYEGGTTEEPLEITVENITSTTNSITIKITTSGNKGGALEIYKKTETDAEYTLEKTATGEEAIGLEYTIENLEQDTKYIIKIVATKNGQTKEITAEQTTLKVQNSVAPSTATTHTAKAITYSWDELSTIAQMISNNSSITNDTLEVNVKLNEVDNTLGVGDTATVDSKTVRILGFNHDTLTTSTAYDGVETATGKAGISFEYVDFIDVDGNGTIKAGMNSSNDNTGGWGSCALRTTLNSTTYNSLSIKNKIKQVQKEFIQTYNNADSKTYSSDYLWLLSCGEIWNNGYGGETRGYAIATEGSQYKYYKTTLGSTAYNSSTNVTKKTNTSSPSYWWLRSPRFNGSNTFCYMCSDGSCGFYGQFASDSYGVAPGFSI